MVQRGNEQPPRGVGPWEDRRSTSALASSRGYMGLRRQESEQEHRVNELTPSESKGNGREVGDGRGRETHGTSLLQ